MKHILIVGSIRRTSATNKNACSFFLFLFLFFDYNVVNKSFLCVTKVVDNVTMAFVLESYI